MKEKVEINGIAFIYRIAFTFSIYAALFPIGILTEYKGALFFRYVGYIAFGVYRKSGKTRNEMEIKE